MIKWLIILLIGLSFESAGVVMLKKGMTELGGLRVNNVRTAWSAARLGLTNLKIVMGVVCEAIFFGTLLLLMAHSDISFLWPMTGLSFVFATIAATIFLHEEVAAMRWAGVILIVFGAGLISYSEKAAEIKKEHAAVIKATAGTR
jgi:drug/metabolite transporter (DMT)-like permease